jgi:hypothetical protein
MRHREIHAEFYCGVDVHPKKSYLCVLDKSGEKRLGLNLKNNFDNFKETVNPFLPNLAVGCESTYAYYWLADGCHKAGIQFYLGHAMYMPARRQAGKPSAVTNKSMIPWTQKPSPTC